MIDSLTKVTQLRLINLRWLSVLAMALAAIISPSILGSTDLMPRLLALAIVIGCANVCLLLAATLSRGDPDGLALFSPFVQLTFDLAAWGGYVYLSGGASNPLISVLLPLVAIGAIVLGGGQSWLLGIAAILAYSFLWKFNQPLAIADARTATNLHLLGMWLVFAMSAIVVIWFIRKMTDAIRHRDQALAEAREQAIRDDWLISLGSLAAGAVHELSTPLGTMNILVDEWLDDACLSMAKRTDLELMQSQIETCKRALAQLTQRAGNPRSEQMEQVSAGTWLNAVLAAWGALNPLASLIIDIPVELNEQAVCLDIAVERGLANLLDNALGAGATLIVIGARIDGESLIVRIDDNGLGISGAALQSFSAGTPIASACGMGIGLLLSRTAVERQGGKLTLESLPDRGTRACLALPLNIVQEEVNP